MTFGDVAVSFIQEEWALLAFQKNLYKDMMLEVSRSLTVTGKNILPLLSKLGNKRLLEFMFFCDWDIEREEICKNQCKDPLKEFFQDLLFIILKYFIYGAG